MAQTLEQYAFRDSRDENARDESAIRTMEGIINSVLYSVAFVWIPVCLALSQCAFD
jgi:hypothetical protein